MALKINKKTKLLKGFKLPRKRKKAFKKYWTGAISTITLNPLRSKSELNVRDIGRSWIKVMYNSYHMNKWNLKRYNGSTIIFDSSK